MTASGLEGRYAVALFELALQDKALAAVERDIKALGSLVTENRDFADFIKNPLRNAKVQAAAVEEAGESARFHPLTRKFLGVLAENRRLAGVPAMVAAFEGLLADYRGEVSALVTSAEALSKAQTSGLKARLKDLLGREVAVETRVDERLLGGLKVQIGSKVIDGTLKTKLDALTIQMKGA